MSDSCVDQIARDRASKVETTQAVSEARNEERWKNAAEATTKLNESVNRLGSDYNSTIRALGVAFITLLIAVIGTLLKFLFFKS